MDIAGFLERYPPFDDLEAGRLADVAGSVEIEHFVAGTDILRQAGEPAHALYVVRKGAVELLDDGRLLDLLGEGEVFGQFSLLAGTGPTVTVRAHEDTLCYLVGGKYAEEVLGTSAGLSFVIGSMRKRIRSAAVHSHPDVHDRRYRPVGSELARPAVSVEPSTTIGEAASVMASERVSSLLIPMRGSWGIVTDRDLRSRVVAVRGSYDAPVETIATFPAITISQDLSSGEALLRMLDGGIHHFPVEDAHGRIIGVVAETDLMGLGKDTPFSLKGSIERATSLEAVAESGRQLPTVVCAMVEARADPIDVGRVIAMVVDSMTKRLLALGIERSGDPPCAWAWLALGSAARHEQALKTDQDHAIAYEAGRPFDEIDPYFAELAGFVVDGLEQSGIPRCHGDAMATTRMLRRPLDGWVDAFIGWMSDPSAEGSVLSSIGYDFRQVAGPLDAEPTLDDAIRTARTQPGFLKHLGRRALDLHPPTGFFRDLVVEHRGEHEGRLDIKHGGILILNNLARAYAVSAGVAAKGTPARFDAAAQAGKLDAPIAGELLEAFHFLWDVRLQHQTGQVLAGSQPDDFIDPATLGTVARRGLKEAFRVIVRAQQLLASDLGITPR